MNTEFSAQQRMLSFAECERICGKRLRDIETLASLAGHVVLPGHLPSLPLETAINMLIYSKAMDQGFEPRVMTRWLPHLRNGTLLELGADHNRWTYEGSEADWRDFLPRFYGLPEDVRPQIAPLLGCCTSVTASELRFFSSSDVEVIRDPSEAGKASEHTPLMVIRAEDLAQQICRSCSGALFTARRKQRSFV